MKFIYPLIFLAAVFIISFFDKNSVSASFDKQLDATIAKAKAKVDSKLTTNSYQAGQVNFLTHRGNITERAIHQVIERDLHDLKARSSYMLTWLDNQRNLVNASAMGLDWKHHFVNSYLVGIRPFAVENKWLPLYTLARMKTYQLDSEQYKTVEMWQNSAQAFVLPRGDCEDHAIILADWLISEGVDAKVVVGTYNTQGHAWVVASLNNKQFILEATAKRQRKSWNHYPLAELALNYHPQYMFNRRDFWVNSATDNQNYDEQHWFKRSTFTKRKPVKRG